jgi:Xaa-Pro aminopeptidase
VSLLPSACRTEEGVLSSTHLKAQKNAVEIAQAKVCHQKDGAAVSQFLHWLELNVGQGDVSELSAAAKLQSLRENIDTFRGLSFNTIAGYGANGAMMHYAADEESNTTIGSDNFFLVDSGGQYWDGTTDITRTQSYGPLSEGQRRDYTLVVKAHIQLCLAKFLKGTRGVQLDMLARQPLWREAINFGCGTGHGVGSYLNVHEGPHNISTHFTDEPLLPGMLVTNEPGIYRSGEHGVRIENIMLVVEAEENEFGQFYQFEQLTLCPIDTKPLLLAMLLDEERDYLNDYHRRVFEGLNSQLDAAGVAWLKEKTKAV